MDPVALLLTNPSWLHDAKVVNQVVESMGQWDFDPNKVVDGKPLLEAFLHRAMAYGAQPPELALLSIAHQLVVKGAQPVSPRQAEGDVRTPRMHFRFPATYCFLSSLADGAMAKDEAIWSSQLLGTAARNGVSPRLLMDNIAGALEALPTPEPLFHGMRPLAWLLAQANPRVDIEGDQYGGWGHEGSSRKTRSFRCGAMSSALRRLVKEKPELPQLWMAISGVAFHASRLDANDEVKELSMKELISRCLGRVDRLESFQQALQDDRFPLPSRQSMALGIQQAAHIVSRDPGEDVYSQMSLDANAGAKKAPPIDREEGWHLFTAAAAFCREKAWSRMDANPLRRLDAAPPAAALDRLPATQDTIQWLLSIVEDASLSKTGASTFMKAPLSKRIDFLDATFAWTKRHGLSMPTMDDLPPALLSAVQNESGLREYFESVTLDMSTPTTTSRSPTRRI